MKIIYFVVAVIFGALSWICTQTVWEYQYILQYIFLFLTSWFVCLIFLYQEENEGSKKYTLFTPYNLIYVIIVGVLIFLYRDYDLDKWQTSMNSFYKVVFIINGIQGLLIMAFYKLRDIYHHM